MEKINRIIKDIRNNGDKAVKKYAELFDGVKLNDFKISKQNISRSYKEVSPKTIKALIKSAENIRDYARFQLKNFRDFEYTKNGVTVGQKMIPIEKIGVYVPGGRYPLPSTALMCVIPAKVAGVGKIIVCSPKIPPVTIAAADLAGADEIFNIGGIQAIAAMAYGTETVPGMDKIVGPGNIYVTRAKKEIFGDCGIDLLAGPSEILIIADKYADPKFIAADLLAQAEHDAKTRIFFVADSKKLMREVKEELENQIETLKTKNIIKEAFKNKKEILAKDMEEMIKLANEIAPEHLSLQVKSPRKYLKFLKNYGSLFLGGYSAVAFGDYCSGPNHVLPTSKAARFTGGLSVKDFIKTQTYQYLNKKGAKSLADTATEIASVEGLDAHKKSIERRLR